MTKCHALVQLIENWKKAPDENFQIVTVLMDLPKASDCIPHELLIAKLYACGLSEETTKFFYSYVKKKKTKINFGIWSTPRVYPQSDLS